MGLLSSDGNGNVTGNVTDNKDGKVCQFTITGTYTVNPDGTGTMALTVTAITPNCTSSSSNEASVLFDMNRGVAFVNTTGGVALGRMTKQ